MDIKRIFLIGLVSVCSAVASGDDLAEPFKAPGTGNPISASIYCADPTAIVHDGRLYVYGTNDHQQYVVNNGAGENNYGAIKSLVVFSTDDMVNWTYHGIIDVGSVCGSWCVASWAPSIVSRVEEDGLTHFYLYFSNSGGGVGVITATSPTGPWKSPLKKSLISHSTPGASDSTWPFDPGVVIDADGTGWLAFGGGEPNSKGNHLQPGNSHIVKLGTNMVSVVGEAVEIPAPYHFEANELNVMDGKLVYTYCTSWTDRNAWSSYGSSAAAPGVCSMCYMTTTEPLNPASWEYKKEYLANPGTFGYSYGNNHTHLQKFGDNYYLFYHNMSLEKASGSKASGFRSIGVSKVTVNEQTQSISKAVMNNSAPTALKKLDPYLLHPATTMSTAGGLAYEDFAKDGKRVVMEAGDWTMVRGVDFGTQGAVALNLTVSGAGTLEVRLDKRAAEPVARFSFDTEGAIRTFVVDSLNVSLLKGNHNVYFVCTEAEKLCFENWQFVDKAAGFDKPQAEKAATCVRTDYFDVCGRPAKASSCGLIIERRVMSDGTVQVRKFRNEN